MLKSMLGAIERWSQQVKAMLGRAKKNGPKNEKFHQIYKKRISINYIN
jgi:hypothetical protein